MAAQVLTLPLPATALAPRLLNDWQRGFPLQRRPFAAIADALGTGETEVLLAYRALAAQGALSRIGGPFAAQAGGAGLLAAFAVPPGRLEAVAATVSACPAVNHNYQREHDFNLWFVVNGADAAQVDGDVDALEAATGLRALRLPMRRAYRIDLGFDLNGCEATPHREPGMAVPPVADGERALAALVEAGLPLEAAPFDLWSAQAGLPVPAILATLQRWLDQGTMRRFGVVVRHHELGIAANAMTVFDVPDGDVDARGAALARQAGVTLAYRRERGFGWPYNLYCMVHGRDRDAVSARIDRVVRDAGLDAAPRSVLFSVRRFKQTGARRFRAMAPTDVDANWQAGHVAA